MSTELFADLPQSPSPKLQWLKKHGLTTTHDPELEGCPESPETGETCFPWACAKWDAQGFILTELGQGMTEDEAIFDFCAKTGLPHYSLPQ